MGTSIPSYRTGYHRLMPDKRWEHRRHISQHPIDLMNMPRQINHILQTLIIYGNQMYLSPHN